MGQHRDRYMELLLERIGEDAYPSGELMDRVEAAVTRPEHLAASRVDGIASGRRPYERWRIAANSR